jgi:hypothetical protein
MTEVPSALYVSETAGSFNGMVVWTVYVRIGRCECGEKQMRNAVAYFVDRDDAIFFVEQMEIETRE